MAQRRAERGEMSLPDPMADFRHLARDMRGAADFIDAACESRVQIDSLRLIAAVADMAEFEREFYRSREMVERDIGMNLTDALECALDDADLAALRGHGCPQAPTGGSRAAFGAAWALLIALAALPASCGAIWAADGLVRWLVQR